MWNPLYSHIFDIKVTENMWNPSKLHGFPTSGLQDTAYITALLSCWSEVWGLMLVNQTLPLVPNTHRKVRKTSTQHSTGLMKILISAVTLVAQWAITKIIMLKLEDSFCQLWNTKELSENLSILPSCSISVCCPACCCNKIIKFFHSYSNYSSNSHSVFSVVNVLTLYHWTFGVSKPVL